MQAITYVRAVLTLEVMQGDKITSSITVTRNKHVGLLTSDEIRSKSSAASAIQNLVPEMTTDAAIAVLHAVGTDNHD